MKYLCVIVLVFLSSNYILSKEVSHLSQALNEPTIKNIKEKVSNASIEKMGQKQIMVLNRK